MGKYSYCSLPLTRIVNPRHHIMAFFIPLVAYYLMQRTHTSSHCPNDSVAHLSQHFKSANWHYRTCIHIYICTYIHITDLATIHNCRTRARPRNLCLQNVGLQFDRQSVMSTLSNFVLKYSYAIYKHHSRKKTKKKNNPPSLKVCQELTNMVPQK
jgi:hypothetical protein